MNHAIVNLIGDQFWTVKGDTVKMGKINNKYLDFPDPLLVACASGVSPIISFLFSFYNANSGIFLSFSALSRAFLSMENSKVLEVLSRSLMRIFILSTTLLFLLSQLADKNFQMHRLCLPSRRL
jgi:hypothetical protein